MIGANTTRTPCFAGFAKVPLAGSETGLFSGRSFLFGGPFREVGLEPNDLPIQSALYSGYAPEEWSASRKFVPSYVKFPTPLTKIRITTFVGNGTESLTAGIDSALPLWFSGIKSKQGVFPCDCFQYSL